MSAVKGILDFLFGGDEPTPGRITRAVKAVTQPHGDPAARMSGADRLKAWGTPAAIAGLMRRFTIQTPSGAVDLEECQQIEEMLVELGAAAVGPIVSYLEREPRVAYPARALERILPREEFVGHILGVLSRLEAGFGSQPEQRAGLLRALEEIDDPRVAPGVRQFLADPDDDVAIAALACIVRNGDPQFRDDLVRMLVDAAGRPRVRQEAVERLALLGWPLGEGRRQVETLLPAGFVLDKKGRVVATGLLPHQTR